MPSKSTWATGFTIVPNGSYGAHRILVCPSCNNVSVADPGVNGACALCIGQNKSLTPMVAFVRESPEQDS
jgi:hypothetical protein